MNMHTFIPIYLKNHVAQLRVAKETAAAIARYFGPLHQFALADLSPIQVEDWFHSIGTVSPSMANKCLSQLKTMYEKARDWRLFFGDNPARRIKRYPETSRRRFVQPDEMPKLLAALQYWPDRTQCYVLLCLLVGCRRSEALTLKWADLDAVNNLWHKAHTKSHRAQTVPVPALLMQRIQALNHAGPYVFSYGKVPWSTSHIHSMFNGIRRAAGIPDVTIHDLRRTTASWLASNGENMAVIANVLNHSSLQHTAVYARLNVSPVAKALETNSYRILGGCLKTGTDR